MSLTKYRVTIDLLIAEGHPRKWVADAIAEGLDSSQGEDILNVEVVELEDEVQADGN